MTTERITPERKEQRSGEKVLLGEGAQVKVYDIGNGRIRKEPKTIDEAVVSIEKWYDGSSQGTSREYAEMLENYRRQGLEYVADLIKRHPEVSWYFGNPTIYADGSLEQDTLTPLGDYIQQKASPDDKKAIINEYIGAIKTSWKLGCYDWTFNLLDNYGVNEAGAVVMLDFGEMGYDKQTMHDMIGQKKWRTAHDPTLLDDETRDHYFKAIEATITHEALEERWRTIADR